MVFEWSSYARMLLVCLDFAIVGVLRVIFLMGDFNFYVF